MTYKDDSNTPPTDPQGQSSPQSPMRPPTPLEGALPDGSKGEAEDTKQKADELAREFRVAEKWVIGTNVALAIIGIFALCIYNGQLKKMGKQLEAMQTANGLTQQTVCLTWQQARIQRIQASPIVGVKTIDLVALDLTERGHFIAPRIVLGNTGGGPALNVTHKIALGIFDSQELKPDDLPKPTDWGLTPARSTGVIMQSDTAPIIQARFDLMVLGLPKVRSLQDGHHWLYIHEWIQYSDRFSITRITHACSRVDRDGLHVCNIGDYIEDNETPPPQACTTTK